MLSAAIAVTILGEPLHVALVLGTLLVVAGGTLLVRERGGPVGTALARHRAGPRAPPCCSRCVTTSSAGPRAATTCPGFVAATASLVSAALVILIVVALRPDARARIRQAARPFVPSGLVYGISYACLYSAFDRGRVTVVAPLVATESLFAVLISMVLLRRSERIGAAAASRRCARGRRRRAHLELSLNTPAMCSVRRKRMK